MFPILSTPGIIFTKSGTTWSVVIVAGEGGGKISSQQRRLLELVRNLVAHGDARVGKWRGNWRMEWVASTLTPPPNVVYPALLKLVRTPRLPAVNWTDAPTDLNGLVRFGERRNLVSARVLSRSARAIRAYELVSSIWDGAVTCLPDLVE